MLRYVFYAYLFEGEGFLEFLSSGLLVKLVGCSKYITFILVISLIIYALYDLLFRDK